MSTSKEMMDGVRVLIGDLLRLKCQETFVIIADSRTYADAKKAADYATGIKAKPILITIDQELSGIDPPKPVVEASKAADVVLGATTLSLATTKVSLTTSSGGRFFSCPGFSKELLDSVLLQVNFDEVHEKAGQIAKLFTMGKEVRILSGAKNEYSIVLDISGRPGNSEDGRCFSPGSFASLSLEANVAPNEDNATGTIEVSAFHPSSQQIAEKVRLHFEEGRIEDIHGQKSDKFLIYRTLKAYEDNRMYHVGELGIGLNNGVRFTKKSYIMDESALLTCHLGMGNNILLGGIQEANGHMDFVIEKPTMYIDDGQVMEKGELTV